MFSSEKIKKMIVILAVAFVALLIVGSVIGGIANLIDPPSNHIHQSTDTSHHTSTSSSSSGSSSSSSGSSHYGISNDPYKLAKNDPGAYYDHYEYGDNYEIDDYLESEGFD